MRESQLEFGVHDPTIIEADGVFYLYSTDTRQPETSGVPIRKSSDLVYWKFDSSALDGVPEDAKSWSKAVGLWAPEIINYQGEYRMYYSASTFGSTTSYIGLATATSPTGPFVDQGLVVKTSPDLCTHNAIDANIVTDRDGEQWMVYGSFFGGIYILPIDKKTGKPSQEGFGKRIAARPKSVDTAIEGCFVYYHPETDYFYLFSSYDSLSNTYHIRVARSRNVDGPYVDIKGQDINDLEIDPLLNGVKLLGSFQFEDELPVYAPGHNSILKRSDGRLFVVHHARRKTFSDQFFLNVRELKWLSNGWPVISPLLYDGGQPQSVNDLLGEWDIIRFAADSDLKQSELVSLKEQDLTAVTDNEYLWEGYSLLFWQELENGVMTPCLAGLNADGFAVIGKKRLT
ncbi:arabinan endo-1,5-alpha-L-arabinosidase [Streptococcus moroccensis]|uniref:Arabinan endo-1,5-alpha-L-arabinosidase n=1 Tax=Streptococcus moroccensis TaxID=1451356 RepID=A0ABT9YTK3_9STRE|nr:arabinan endo-1,5-alpha-L-arabinosidase [Streptococcus moroccensis]MDQ0223054.1 arabinan endo-1,5-alpha-L-arabinosidase [Streptococcus moroccensis]